MKRVFKLAGIFAVLILSFQTRAMAQTLVEVTVTDAGGPIENAGVFLDVAGMQQFLCTGADGVASFEVNTGEVTLGGRLIVRKNGFEAVEMHDIQIGSEPVSIPVTLELLQPALFEATFFGRSTIVETGTFYLNGRAVDEATNESREVTSVKVFATNDQNEAVELPVALLSGDNDSENGSGIALVPTDLAAGEYAVHVELGTVTRNEIPDKQTCEEETPEITSVGVGTLTVLAGGAGSGLTEERVREIIEEMISTITDHVEQILGVKVLLQRHGQPKITTVGEMSDTDMLRGLRGLHPNPGNKGKSGKNGNNG